MTAPEVTSISSRSVLSLLYNLKSPEPALTASLNVNTIFAPTATPVALSAGEVETKVGFTVSTEIKFNDEELLMPAYELPTASSNAVAAIWR